MRSSYSLPHRIRDENGIDSIALMPRFDPDFHRRGNFFTAFGIITNRRLRMKSNSRRAAPRLMAAAAVLLVVVLWTSPAGAGDRTDFATFAGGCFWCIEADFEKVEGVLTVTSGYTGGRVPNPTYKQVSAGGTGHTEAIRVVFDPDRVTYKELLDVFWRNIDPTVSDRQFCDVGSQYRAGIFYHTEEQKEMAEESRDDLERTKMFPDPIVTEITAAGAFYPAEAYHQDYYKKNSLRYSYYRKGCGRDARLAELWGKK
jgi:peptide-methionine (S)-S-oxide reductase